MTSPVPDETFVRDAEAYAFVASVEDPVAREALKFCLARARMKAVPIGNVEIDRWRADLPVAPFDLEFFVRTLYEVFSRRVICQRILDGETVAQATGWDE